MTTERLLLRPWDPDDPDDVSAALDVYRRLDVARWLGSQPKPWPDREFARQRLRAWQQVAEESEGLGLWAVVPRAGQRPVGTVLLVRLPDADSAPTDEVEVGWHLHPGSWGHGYATEAAARLLAHGFQDLGLPAVNAVAYAGNEPSFAVMRRLGMTFLGETDRWYGVTLQWWRVLRP